MGERFNVEKAVDDFCISMMQYLVESDGRLTSKELEALKSIKILIDDVAKMSEAQERFDMYKSFISVEVEKIPQ